MRLTFRLPFQPKDSGKYYHGSFNILCFEFSDQLPTKLNNFLWKIRGLPVINVVSIFCARGGLQRCYRCNKIIWTSECPIDQGNIYDRIFKTGMTIHRECKMTKDSNEYKVKYIQSHVLNIIYQPDWFIATERQKVWANELENVANIHSSLVLQRIKDFPLDILLSEKIKKKGSGHSINVSGDCNMGCC